MPIDPKILSVQPGADRANAGEADPRAMLSFDLATPDTAPDEWQRAAARRVSEHIGLPDPDGRVWKGRPFPTGAEYLGFMRGMLKSGDVWEYAATEDLKAFEAADGAGRAAIARAALGMADRAAERAGRAVPEGYGFADGAPELQEAPEDVLAANARLRADREARRRYNLEQTARSEPFAAQRPKEDTAADRKTLDAWRGRRADEALVAAHREKLLRDNLWAAWLSVTPSLSGRAKEIATGLFRGGTIRGEDIADFQRLDETEQAAVARLARLSRNPAAGTLLNTLGDAGIGFINGVATLPLNAVKQIDTLTTSIDQAVFGKNAGLIDNAEMNRRARTEQRLMEALDDPAGIDPSGADHGYLARSVIGAVSTLPYMGYAASGGMGVAGVALDFMQRLDDRIAADGGDVHGQGVEWAARKAVLGALYAGVERMSALPVFKDAGDIALKTAFLKLAKQHGAAAAEKVALHIGKETFKETLEESVQAVIEEHAASVGLGRGDGWADAARAGVREFAETAGTMGLVAGIGAARQGVQTRSVRGRAELADFTAAALRREAFILSDNPYAGRGDAESVGRSWTVAAETLDGYRSDWAEGGTAALVKRPDLTAEQAAVLGHVFEGEREGREAGEFLLGRNLAARVDADATGAVFEELDAARVREIVAGAGADAEARLAEMGFTEAGAARVAGYVRKEAALGNRFARVLGDIRESLARDLEADPERAGAQAGAVRRMLQIQPLREVYQRAGTRKGASKAFREIGFTEEQAENLAAVFHEERAFAASPEAAAEWRAAYLDASREATPGERLRRMTGFEARPAPEAGEGASLLTLRGRDGKTLGEIILRPEAQTFDPESPFAGETVEQATGGAVTAADWQALTPEGRRDAARTLGIRARGGFTVTDPADPSVSADGAQADILTGKITLDPEAPSATLYHEAAHAWLAALRRAGKITEADIAKLREAYGPSAADPQWFNEEALADDIREIGAETDYTPDKPLARRFIDAVRRLAGAARAEESRRTAASGARQALYESIVYGKPFEGVGDFAAVPKAADTAGESKASADPIAGASTAQAATGDGQQETGDKQPETRNQKPETRNPEPETKNQKPQAGRWTAATPQGNLRVGGHWVIAPRDRFISDTDPRYDFSLQNRTRDAALGSAEQVAEIVAKFDALRLLDSPDTANGAPVAIPLTLKNADGKNETFYMVLSGNGRFRALDKLDADHRGDEYRKPIQTFADARGIPYEPADLTEDAHPRLVRVMTRVPVGATNQRIAELSNQNAVLQMTDAERAYSDAALIERDGTADLYAANKDGLPAKNGSDPFFAWFVRAAGDASLLDSKGNPTDAARARARRAMLALAVGRGRRGKETVMAFTEQAEALGLDRQRDALLMSAGALSALGEAKPDYALADEMSRAAADLLLLARQRKAGKAVTAAELIAAGDMLDAMPPASAEALRVLDAARPAEGIAAAFQRYADLASKIDTDTDDMFGEAPAAKDALLRQAVADTDVKAPAGPRYSIALAARRYALATGMPAEGERLVARQLEFLFARHMDPAYIASRARAAETRRANAAAAERAKAVARRDAHGRALANPDDPQAWAEAFAASEDGTVSRIAHDFFMGGGGPQRFPHAYGGKPLYGTRVNTPRDAAALLMPLRNPYQESFKAIFLDDKRRVLGAEVCTLGLLDSATVHPRETFRRGIELGASQVILAHNHPSGDPRPSKEDRDITRRLDEAAKIIGLQYLEHIITNGQTYYSLASDSLERLDGPAKADWEAVAAGETRHIREPQTVAALARALRQGAENVIHAVMLDTKNRITAVKRIPFDPARIADPAYQDEALLREAFRGAVANPTAAIILEVTDRAVTAYAAQGLHARAKSQARAVGIQLLDTLYRQGGWSWSVKADARVMPMEADAAAEPAAPRYSVSVNLDDYFNADPEAREIPLDALRTIKDEPETSIANALRHIRAAKAGERAKRAPVAVADNGDGTFTVIDGNATTAALARMGIPSVRARVEGADTGTRLGNSALILRPSHGGRLRQRGVDGLDTAAAVNRLLDMARENTRAVRELCDAAAASGSGKVNMRPGLKNKTRILEKTVEDYGGDAARVVDITGGEVWLPDTADFNDALKAIQKNLPAGAEIARVKPFNIGRDGEGGYGDVKVSVMFANGGIGEIILASEYMLEAKHRRGGHHLYKSMRALEKYKANHLLDEEIHKLKNLEEAIYARGAAAPDAASFASMKSMASSALTRLRGEKSALLSAEDISLVKSLSSDLHLARPPSVDSNAMPASSFMKYISTPSLSKDNASVTDVDGNVNTETRYSLETSAAYHGDPADAPKRAIAKIRLMTSAEALKRHPDYGAAKAGDRAASIRVASALSKADRIQALAADHPGAVLVPVLAEEATGSNQLPAALAAVINIATGLKVDHSIVQSVRAHRTGQGHLYRMAHRPKFTGDVTEGQEYIIVDDLAAMGGTLAELRHYIETHGGIVVDAVTLAAGRFGNVFGLTPKTEAGLVERFGVNFITELLERSGLYGGNWKYLSEGEGRELLKALPPDAGRDGASAGRGAQDQPLRGGAPGGNPGGDGNPPVRYAIDLTGSAYSKENTIVGFLAAADITGKGFPSRGTVAAIAEKMGLAHHRYDELAQRARALAAETVDDAIRKAAMSSDPGNVAYAIGELARRAEALVRAGAEAGARLARNEDRIRTLSEAGVAAAMRAVTGADYADIETDTDIDIAASILAADPKAFEPQAEKPPADTQPPAPAGPDADPDAPADPAAPDETDEEAPELTDRQRAEIARKRREREARIQALLDAARDRAARNRFRDEERRRRRAANEKAGAEEEAAAGGAAQGGAADAASARDEAGSAAPADTAAAAPVDFTDRWEAAAFLRVWAFDRFRRDNPNRRDTGGDLSKNLVAVEFYRKTAVRELTDLARKLLSPGAPRETVRAMIGDIVPGLTANQIERRTAQVFGVINRHAVRERQRSLVKKFRAEIKRQYIKGKEFEELGVDLGRALTGAIEEDARYIMRVCELSDRALDGETSALQEERDRLNAVIAQREGMTDEKGNPLDVGGDDMASRRALRQLALLDTYGAMVDMMPGEILDLTGDALATLGREAVELRRRWEAYDALVKSIRAPFVRSIARGVDDPAASESVWNAVADSQLSMLRQRLDFLTRYEADPVKREAARTAISDLMNLLAEGNVEYTNAVADDRAALMGALGQIFRRDDGRPDRKKIRAYLRRLDERVPRELAARLTRQGRQNAMTYGQMLHLLAYLDQWASYKDNIIRHDRRGQAALIRSFVFEDPKTGEARRALTNEDTQLVEWLRRAHYVGKRGAISAVTRRLAGREIDSPDPLYHPVKMLLSRTSALTAAPGGAAWQPMAGAFSRRVRNSLDVDETASILDLFHSRSHDTAVLTAFGERGMVIREVLTSRGFQDAVRRFHGDRALSKILRQVAQSLDGGRARGGGQSAAASLAQRLTTYMYLGFNPHSAAKQTASLPVFAARLGFRRLGSILFSPINWQAVTRLKESDEYRARYGTGPASGMNAADRAAYDAPDADPLKKVFGDWGLWMTRKADWAISAWVGQGVYRDLKATYIDRGMAEAEADRRAISETFTLIEETQQSGRAENLPEMSREHGFLGRLMVQFATSPLQQMQYEIKEFAEWRDLAANGGTEQSIREARNKFMRALFINHVIVPGIMAGISGLYKAATGDEPDWKKEGYWQTLLIAAIMGQFGRIFFAGALAEQTLRVLFLRKPPYMGQLVPAEGVIRFAGNLAYPVRDIVTWDTEHMQADLMRLLKSVALTRLPVKIYERAAGDE